MYYVYVILKKDKNITYIGYCKDIEKRLRRHSLKYACELIYYEAYKTEEDARNRERRLKLYGSAWRGLKQRLDKSLKD
jgi:putative endonuclease